MMMLETPLISVITVVLNGVSTLEDTLRSVCDQPYPAIELIVIDGGSSDGSLEVIKQYSHKIAYWETGQDSGISDAFNRGLQKSSGDLIAILNSDDQWMTNTAEVIAQAYKSNPEADVFYGPLQFYDPHDRETYVRTPDLHRMTQRMSVFHPSLFIQKEAYKKVGEYSSEYKFAMDSQWVHRAIKQGLKFQRVDAVLSQMRLGGRSDKHFASALNEYRRSLVENKMVSPVIAFFYFFKYACAKYLLRFRVLKRLRRQLFPHCQAPNSMSNKSQRI